MEITAQIPTKPGFYVLSNDGTEWRITDGLTYRTWFNTIRVMPNGEIETKNAR